MLRVCDLVGVLVPEKGIVPEGDIVPELEPVVVDGVLGVGVMVPL